MKLVNLTDLVDDVDLHIQSNLLQNAEIIQDWEYFIQVVFVCEILLMSY